MRAIGALIGLVIGNLIFANFFDGGDMLQAIDRSFFQAVTVMALFATGALK
jgi:hypothetical protein